MGRYEIGKLTLALGGVTVIALSQLAVILLIALIALVLLTPSDVPLLRLERLIDAVCRAKTAPPDPHLPKQQRSKRKKRRVDWRRRW